MERRRYVAHLLPSGGRDARVRIVAYIEDNGWLSQDVHVSDVHVVNEGMRVAPGDTLWLVSLADHVPSIAQGPPAPRASRMSLLATTAIPRDLDEAVKPPGRTRPQRPRPQTSDIGDRREQAGEMLQDSLGDPRALRPEFMVRDAIRLATGLMHDLPDAAAVRAALTSGGIPIQLGCAPDFVALEGDEWIRSLGWPVCDGCLHAPSSPADLVLDVVRLGRAHDLAHRQILGVTLLPSATSDRATRILDWRTDEQVLGDAKDVAALVGKIRASSRIDGLEEVMSGLERLASHAPSSREVFRLRRLLEVAEDRGRLPHDFASLLPDMEMLQGLIDRELDERRRVLLGELAAEIESERDQHSRALEELRNEIADAERAVALLHAREETHRRVSDELRAEISSRIDRRTAELTSANEGLLTSWLARARVDRERVEELAARIAEIEGAFQDRRTAREQIAEMIREALQDERMDGIPAKRVVEALPLDEAAVELGEAAFPPDALIDDPAVAMASLRWHAHESGLDERALQTAFSVAAVGLLPIFVGAAAGDAAIGLARAIGGADFSTLHCDPTLIAAADLLDPKRARTDVLLAGIDAAQRHPERWYAVALTSIDWSPCTYWLPALGTRRFGSEELPQNLLIVGAMSVDGPRTHVPLGAMRNAVPIDVAGWSSREEARWVDGAWSTTVLPPPEEADEGRAGPLYLAETIGLLNASLSATSLRLIVGSARAGRERFRWTAEDAYASLSFVAEWLAAARDGATISSNVQIVMKKFASGEEA